MKSIPIGGRTCVNPDEVILLQADINYTVLYFKDGSKSIVATPLKSLEKRFTPFNFFRTHKSYLVNLGSVSCFLHATNYVKMENEHKASVSRRKKMELKRHLNLP